MEKKDKVIAVATVASQSNLGPPKKNLTNGVLAKIKKLAIGIVKKNRLRTESMTIFLNSSNFFA